LRSGRCRPARAAQADAPHVRLPRGDVGRPAAGDFRTRLRLRRLRRQALRSPARRSRRSTLSRLAGAGRRVTLPERARVVIIGGGVGGTSIAYHLVKRGWRDVVLLERAQLTSGSTFHSAGLVGQLRSTMPLTRLMMNSVALYAGLTDETGVDVGWHPVGSLRLASSRERMEELERQAGWATSFGLPLELVSAEEAHRRFPLMTREGVLGAAFLPTDGYLDPSGLPLALAEGARRGGARTCEGARLTGIGVDHGAVHRVDTEQGSIEAEVVVNAGALYAPEIAAMAELTVPIIPMAHQYLLARIKDQIPEPLPTIRDPDLRGSFPPDVSG